MATAARITCGDSCKVSRHHLGAVSRSSGTAEGANLRRPLHEGELAARAACSDRVVEVGVTVVVAVAVEVAVVVVVVVVVIAVVLIFAKGSTFISRFIEAFAFPVMICVCDMPTQAAR